MITVGAITRGFVSSVISFCGAAPFSVVFLNSPRRIIRKSLVPLEERIMSLLFWFCDVEWRLSDSGSGRGGWCGIFKGM